MEHVDTIAEEEEVVEDVEQNVPSQGENLQVTSEDEEPANPGGKEGSTRNTTSTMPTTNTTTTTTQNQKISTAAEPTQQPEETSEEEEPIEMATEVNDHLSRPDEAEGVGGSNVVEIVSHDWKLGHLQFKVRWSSDDTTSWEHIKDMREDYPKMTARYIVSNKVSRFKRGGDRVLQCAKKVERDLGRAVRRIARLYDFFLSDDDEVKQICRVQKTKKKKKFSTAPVFKYGIQVPRTVEQARQFDAANGNTYWQDAMDKEVKALMDLDCFEVKPAGHSSTLDNTWQKTTLHMVFDVKQSLDRKCRLVARGKCTHRRSSQLVSSYFM